MLKNNLLLVLILILAFSLRVFKITTIPPSLNWDETSIGYNAYSILKTGKDEWGEFMPIHFKSFGEYKLPSQIYASIPAIAIFGLNEFGVRITPVIYGTLTVLLLYLLLQRLYNLHHISLIGSFLLAVSPWHIQLTRGSFESSFSLFWFLMAVWLLVKGLKNPPKGEVNPKWIIISMIPFVISVYTYNTARVFTPMFLFVFYLVNAKYLIKNFKFGLLGFVTFVVLALPIVPFVLSGDASARYKLVSITDDKGLIPRIEERRNLSKLPPIVTKLIHNRYTYNTYYFSKNYFAHFTPDFLFLKGAGHRQHHVQGIGELYWVQAPFLLFGFYLLLKRKDESLKILLPWLLLAFVPVSMTNDSIPNALRTLIAVPVYQIITAVGLYEFVKLKKYTKIVIGISVILFGLNFYLFSTNLYTLYPIRYSRDWQYGNKEVVEYIKNNQDQYDLIVFTRHYGEPHIFTLFNLKYDPAKYQSSKNLERFETFDWVRVLRFDKYYFPDLGDEGTKYDDIIRNNPNKKMLFIGKSGDFPEYKKILERINFLDGSEAFEITTN